MQHEFLLVEKYRPQVISDMILPENLRSFFNNMIEKGEIQSHILHGSPGTGKTTAAKALCRELGVEYLVINGSDETGIDVLRNKIKSFASTVSAFADNDRNKVVIIDEAEYLSNAMMSGLRNFQEEYSNNANFILTANYINRIIEPLHSRMIPIEFNKVDFRKPKILAEFLKRLIHILKTEGIEYEKEVLLSLINKHAPDWRRILNECQRYATERGGKIDSGLLAKINDLDISDLVKSLKEKNFRDMRTWVSLNPDIDFSSIVRRLYDQSRDLLEPSSIPQIVLILNEYQYKHGFVVDREINTVAMLTEIMLKAKFA